MSPKNTYIRNPSAACFGGGGGPRAPVRSPGVPGVGASPSTPSRKSCVAMGGNFCCNRILRSELFRHVLDPHVLTGVLRPACTSRCATQGTAGLLLANRDTPGYGCSLIRAVPMPVSDRHLSGGKLGLVQTSGQFRGN